MLTLHGSPISNYHNKAKLALLEKGVPFEEQVVDFRNKDDALFASSPLGKIPFLTTEQGCLCESQVILEYLESVHPQPALLPKDPFAAAKVRELVTFLDWHLEMAVRQLYGVAFFGAPPLSEGNLARIRREIEQKLAGVKRLLKMAPYAAGDIFTMADCSAFVDLPLAGLATKTVYGEDLLLANGIDYKPYLKFIGERASAQRVQADRKAALAKG
ncbi:glutathione S-transferase family protein [Ramlibacter sp. USB13]|uniref:Glutathione S-transferase family protein n=1 Tax=Ramlibacter cellulosilyticus TaxID=2764187 RepID=A0A923SAZ1_9BURK|nr:glutathione S-transferase family protein [Ramlibacter cellulosilyticus]MBC5783264.1 glutathione S-transferase family protein [Ramlibacter cellulosilyticus]